MWIMFIAIILFQVAVIDGEMIYVISDNNERSYIYISNQQQQTYKLPSGKCTAISNTGEYISTTSPAGEDIVIRSLRSLEVIDNITWNDIWKPCDMFWDKDDKLNINLVDDPERYFQYDLLAGYGEIITRTPSVPLFADLPGRYPSSDADFFLLSPTGNHILYARCTRPNFDPSTQLCLASVDFVIYDLINNDDSEILQAVHPFRLTGFDDLNRPVPGDTAWSPNGRYLAYPNTLGSYFDNLFNLGVYDLVTDTYLDLEFFNVEPDWYASLSWSPDSKKLLFWFDAGDLFSEVNPPADPRAFAILDVESRQFTLSNQSYRAPYTGNVMWSPDSAGFAFIDGNSDLYYFDVVAGNTSLVDHRVVRLVSWNELDTIAPTLNTTTSSDPLNNATEVPLNSALMLFFSELIQAGTGNITLYLQDGISVETIDINSANVTFSNSRVIINSTNNLAPGQSYYVQVDAGAIIDMAGNPFAGINDTTTWTFTTIANNPVNCTFEVDSVSTLISAIANANNSAEINTICLADGTYTLTASNVIDYGDNGLPLITSDITLVGLGDNVVIERGVGAPAFRLLHVKDTGTLTLENLTLSNGNAGITHGGAVYARGALTLRDVTITGNFARRGGGVRMNGAPLTVTGSTFQNNSADREGGAIYVSGINSPVDLSTSQFTANSATNSGGGFYLSGTSTALTANDVVFTGNQANGGGAIYAVPSTLNITNATFTSNEALVSDGGAIYTTSDSSVAVANSTFTINEAGSDGGALRAGGNLTLTGSTLTSNVSEVGAAVFSLNAATITGNRIELNAASQLGGGLYVSHNGNAHSITGNCISGNTAPQFSGLLGVTSNTNATDNWWGATDGPVSGNTVSANVIFTPFLSACPLD